MTLKKLLISLFLDSVFDALLNALKIAAGKTSSSVDDKMVGTLRAEKSQIIEDIKRML